MLTPAERREKKQRKMFDDNGTCACTTVCILIRPSVCLRVPTRVGVGVGGWAGLCVC